MFLKTNKKKIFISYRHRGGAPWAQLIKLGLIRFLNIREDDIFLDIDRCGHKWHDKLKQGIEASSYIIIIFHESFEESFSKYDSEDKEDSDIWLEEIKLAINLHKVILPFYAMNVNPDECRKNSLLPEPVLKAMRTGTDIIYTHVPLKGLFASINTQIRSVSKHEDVRVVVKTTCDCKIAYGNTGFKKLSCSKSKTFKLRSDNSNVCVIIAKLGNQTQKYYLMLDGQYDESFYNIINESNGIQADNSQCNFYVIIPYNRTEQEVTFDWFKRQIDVASSVTTYRRVGIMSNPQLFI